MAAFHSAFADQTCHSYDVNTVALAVVGTVVADRMIACVGTFFVAGSLAVVGTDVAVAVAGIVAAADSLDTAAAAAVVDSTVLGTDYIVVAAFVLKCCGVNLHPCNSGSLVLAYKCALPSVGMFDVSQAPAPLQQGSPYASSLHVLLLSHPCAVCAGQT